MQPRQNQLVPLWYQYVNHRPIISYPVPFLSDIASIHHLSHCHLHPLLGQIITSRYPRHQALIGCEGVIMVERDTIKIRYDITVRLYNIIADCSNPGHLIRQIPVKEVAEKTDALNLIPLPEMAAPAY